jgi:hypothetical protein
MLSVLYACHSLNFTAHSQRVENQFCSPLTIHSILYSYAGKGDSGGPAFDKNGVQVGVLSYVLDPKLVVLSLSTMCPVISPRFVSI